MQQVTSSICPVCFTVLSFDLNPFQALCKLSFVSHNVYIIPLVNLVSGQNVSSDLRKKITNYNYWVY